ncbi:hypothetical protein HS088_TW15G01337 [Tripterygium wilfordii]|uniref:Uncharacterized protein n=1 Tax=Tripterygium wilfordii TaxID=458696 RepID=A0A7J7CP34_TRIWF|nr:hypothetical protein HS088_TW15G01337 [Tripterygium wilfordii]
MKWTQCELEMVSEVFICTFYVRGRIHGIQWYTSSLSASFSMLVYVSTLGIIATRKWVKDQCC